MSKLFRNVAARDVVVLGGVPGASGLVILRVEDIRPGQIRIIFLAPPEVCILHLDSDRDRSSIEALLG